MKPFLGKALLSSATLICLVLSVGGQRSREPDHSSFPISMGNYWIYQGIVRRADQNSGQASETEVTWKTEIRRVFPHGDYVAALISGWPGDLNWSDGHLAPTESLLIRSPEGKFYLIGQRFSDAVKKLEESNDSLKELLSEDSLFLDLPLKKGKKFCDADGMARTDGHYCWIVGPPKEMSLDNVKGIQPSRRLAYPVTYMTNPDDCEFEFVPGVGMTSYSYHHHGTVADTELRLVEAHIGADP